LVVNATIAGKINGVIITIMKAIIKQDPDAAEQAIIEHLTYLRKHIAWPAVRDTNSR